MYYKQFLLLCNVKLRQLQQDMLNYQWKSDQYKHETTVFLSLATVCMRGLRWSDTMFLTISAIKDHEFDIFIHSRVPN